MKNITIILLILLAVFVGINIGGYFYQPPYMKEIINSSYNVSTDGFVIVEPQMNATTVYLTGGCYVVSFDVTPDQAYSIQRGMERAIGTRPLTHDVMKDILDIYGIQVLQIRIDRYVSDIYDATIILRKDNKILELDARPSDAIALSVRAHVQLYMKESILKEKGDNLC